MNGEREAPLGGDPTRPIPTAEAAGVTSSSRPQVVVVGAGFAGLAAVKVLRGRPVDVLLLDQHNYHLFTPLLYQVASALLDPSEIAHPVRAILRGSQNLRFALATVRAVDLGAKQLVLDGGRVGFDYLFLAAGSVNDYFGTDAIASRTHGLKDLEQALTLRYRILEQFEAAALTTDAETRSRLLSFAVIGAGPTGVEYAGALSELVRLVLRKDFPELDTRAVRIFLIDALPHVLHPFRPRLRRAAARALAGKGIALVLDAAVENVGEDGVRLRDGRRLEAGTVIWTAGVRASAVGASLGVRLERSGRIPVQPTLQLPDHAEVFVAGDLAAATEDGRPLPMLSPVAIQEGTHAARNVLALAEGRPARPFRYRNRGIMATIGRNQAVAELGPFRFSGRAAWIVWLFVHLALIVGFRNRIVALLDWAEDYFFYDRPVRLIARPVPAPRPADPPQEGTR